MNWLLVGMVSWALFSVVLALEVGRFFRRVRRAPHHSAQIER